MRLAVFDTNVIVSAGIRPDSAPASLLMDWVLDGQIQLVTCPSIIEEYRKVVRRPKFRRYGFPPEWLEFVIDESLQLPDPAPWLVSGSDPSDTVFLSLAHQSGAWLVTGNLKHFPESFRGGVRVLRPAEYLADLQRNRGL